MMCVGWRWTVVARRGASNKNATSKNENVCELEEKGEMKWKNDAIIIVFNYE